MHEHRGPSRNLPIPRGFLACLGLLLALFGANISQQLSAYLGDADVIVARVNHQPITSDVAEKRARRLWGTAYLSLTSGQQRSIVELLVDEELLLQRAESLQLATTDPGLRKIMVAAAIEQVVSEFRRQPITEEQLLAFYRAHRSIFEAPIKFAVDAVRLDPEVDVPAVEALLADGRTRHRVSDGVGRRLRDRVVPNIGAPTARRSMPACAPRRATPRPLAHRPRDPSAQRPPQI